MYNGLGFKDEIKALEYEGRKFVVGLRVLVAELWLLSEVEVSQSQSKWKSK